MFFVSDVVRRRALVVATLTIAGPLFSFLSAPASAQENADKLPAWRIVNICRNDSAVGQCKLYEEVARQRIISSWTVIPPTWREACLLKFSPPLEPSWRILGDCIDDEARRAEDARRQKADAISQAETRRLRETQENARKAAIASAQKATEEAAAREAEETARKAAEEARLKAEADEAARNAAEEARLKAEADKAARNAAEEARLKAEADKAARKAAEEARLKAEADEATRKAAEEARLKAEADETARKAAEEARLKAEADETARKAAEEARLKAEADEAARKAAEDARLKAEADEAARIAEEARLKGEAAAAAKRAAEAEQKAAEARRKAEEDKAERKAAEEARLKAEAEAAERKAAEAARISAEKARIAAEEAKLTKIERECRNEIRAIIDPDPIKFRSSRARIRKTARGQLRKIVAVAQQCPTVKFRVAGHTDSMGDDGTNLWLSKQRAQAVVAFLVKNGLAPGRVVAVGFGKTRPVADNSTRAGRGQNRRIDFEVELSRN